MSTTKFREASPYTKPTATTPTEDYLYQKYLENVTMKKDTHQPQLKLALFGVGRAGTIHLSNIVSNPRVKLMYIVDDVETNWPKLRDYWHLNDVTFLNSKQATKVFQDSNVDAVIVASPTSTHEMIVKQALEAKKAVFCEKPVAEDRLNILKCYEIAKKVGKPLFSAFNRRFDPSNAAVYQKVQNGEVGHVHIVKTVSRDSPLPPIEYIKHSGGIFHDCMVHDFDIITWLLGELPNKVTVQAYAHVPEIKAIGDYDTVIAVLNFPSGTMGMCDVSRTSSHGYDQRMEVYGPKGLITIDNHRPLHGVTVQRGHQGTTQARMFHSFSSRYQEAYQRELDHFIDVVFGIAPISVQPKQTLAVSKIATACEESARTGKSIELYWSPEEIPEF
ncbi:inositol 2-dehydrogenase [Augochlora pura]